MSETRWKFGHWRLWFAAMMAFAASRIAPKAMQPIFRCYCDLLKSFN